MYSPLSFYFRNLSSLRRRAIIHAIKTMPKNQKKVISSKEKDTSKKTGVSSVQNKAVYCGPKNEIFMKIHAKPGAKQSSITDVEEEIIGVQIAAPPVEGEANKELLRYLAEVLQIKKSDLSLEKGSRSREKTVVIFGLSLEDVLTKMKIASTR